MKGENWKYEHLKRRKGEKAQLRLRVGDKKEDLKWQKRNSKEKFVNYYRKYGGGWGLAIQKTKNCLGVFCVCMPQRVTCVPFQSSLAFRSAVYFHSRGMERAVT